MFFIIERSNAGTVSFIDIFTSVSSRSRWGGGETVFVFRVKGCILSAAQAGIQPAKLQKNKRRIFGQNRKKRCDFSVRSIDVKYPCIFHRIVFSHALNNNKQSCTVVLI